MGADRVKAWTELAMARMAGEQAMARMATEKIAPTPANYTIWHT